MDKVRKLNISKASTKAILMLIKSANISHMDARRAIRGYYRVGTPQGGVVSPLLWVIYMNDLLVSLTDGGRNKEKTFAWADDLAVLTHNKCNLIHTIDRL
jgi:hypothetical protein